MKGTIARVVAALIVAVLVFVGIGKVLGGGGSGIKVTAHFPQTVGLYQGSTVRVLGVPVGPLRSEEHTT